MTNEENINTAATNYGYAVAGGCIERGYIQDAFEAGAKWKDQQFKEYLEKKKEDYLSARDNAAMWTEQWTVYHALACTMHQIINELFGGK